MLLLWMCTNPSRLKIDLIASIIFLFEAAGPWRWGEHSERIEGKKDENSKSFTLGLQNGNSVTAMLGCLFF